MIDGDAIEGSTDQDSPSIVMIVGAGGGACCLLLLATLLLVKGRPSLFAGKKPKKSEKNKGSLPSGWEMFVDPATGYPCYVDPSGNTQWDPPPATTIELEMTVQVDNPMKKQKQHHSRNSTQLPVGWDKDVTEDGDRFYIERESGLTAWDAPAGASGGSTGIEIEDQADLLNTSHSRSDTVLPSGWSGHFTETGDRMYYNEELEETRWEAPEGATGGLSGR
jgi:hypothetical protein